MEKLLRLDHFNVLNFTAMREHIHSCKKKKKSPLISVCVCHLAKTENQDEKHDTEFGRSNMDMEFGSYCQMSLNTVVKGFLYLELNLDL